MTNHAALLPGARGHLIMVIGHVLSRFLAGLSGSLHAGCLRASSNKGGDGGGRLEE